MEGTEKSVNNILDEYIIETMISSDELKHFTLFGILPILEIKYKISILDLWEQKFLINVIGDIKYNKLVYNKLVYNKKSYKNIKNVFSIEINNNLLNFLKKAFNYKFLDNYEQLANIIKLLTKYKIEKKIISEFNLILLKNYNNLIVNKIKRVSLEDYAKYRKMSIDDTFTTLSMYISVDQFANYLTMKYTELLSNININEFLYFELKEKLDTKKYNNILAMIEELNNLGNLIPTEILVNAKNEKERIKLLKKFINIAKKFFELNNFHAIFGMAAGFGNAAMHNLINFYKNENKLGQKFINILDDIDLLVNGHNNYSNYYNKIKSIGSVPFIPYIGIINRNIKFIMEGNNIITLNNEINFDYINMFSLIFQSFELNIKYFIQSFESKNKSFEIEKNFNIENYFINVKIIYDEDLIYSYYENIRKNLLK